MTEPTAFLYPFIEADERGPGPLLLDLERSAAAKGEESRALAAATVADLGPALDSLAFAMAERFARGGRLLCFGNGGSASDAAAMAALHVSPPEGRPLPALALTAEPAALTALGNDIGFDAVFARQVIAHGRAGDIAFGFSTSGNSANVIAGLATAKGRGILTAGSAGYGGGEMGRTATLDHCLAVASESVHRVQEAQAAVTWALWGRIQAALS